jgi:diphosphomevalonate decarboxylase
MIGATAVAHPNIALVKYWGKSDERLILPAAGSLSLTLDVFPTTTTVTLDSGLLQDTVELDGHAATQETTGRVRAFLDLVRSRVTDTRAVLPHARVVTRNAVPTGAGLASSAAGFAALAVAAGAAYGLRSHRTELSRLARRGSGSACRSIVPGLAIWHAGNDETSFAEPVPGPDLGMVVVVVNRRGKKVSSREAMRRTRDTSPYYTAWVRSAQEDLALAVDALANDDLAALGAVIESNALRMHAAIAACRPPIRYLAPASVGVFDAAEALRADGLEAYATADAGPNVVLVCRADRVAEVRKALADRLGIDAEDTSRDAGPLRIIAAKAGPGARLVPDSGESADGTSADVAPYDTAPRDGQA